MLSEATVARHKAARIRAIENLDLDWARKALPYMSSDEVRLIALHKSRVECVSIAASLRLESIEWLRSRGYGRLKALPMPPPGILPY